MNHRKFQKGIVFFTTLILLSLAVLVCSALYIVVLRDSYTVQRLKYDRQAYFLAEAGVEEAINALHNDFSAPTLSSYPASLGEGTYSVGITDIDVANKIKQIISIGIVRGVSETIKVQIIAPLPPSFNYCVLSGGTQLGFYGLATVNGNVHSNSASHPSIHLGGLLLPATINGSASTCGTVEIGGLLWPTGFVNPGPPVNNAPAVDLPPFDLNFFNYYFNNAATKYGAPKTFTNQTVGNYDITYVTGNVIFTGNCTVNGCVVATGSIDFQGVITQHQAGNLPAFMSINGDITFTTAPSAINGLIYAGGTISGKNWLNIFTPVNMNGCLYARNQISNIYSTTVNYVRPNPPGLTGQNVRVVSWSGG